MLSDEIEKENFNKKEIQKKTNGFKSIRTKFNIKIN